LPQINTPLRPPPPPSFFSSETLDQRPENPNQNISPKTGPFSKKHLKKRRVLFSSLVPLLGVFSFIYSSVPIPVRPSKELNLNQV
jgi:hypothetical protein